MTKFFTHYLNPKLAWRTNHHAQYVSLFVQIALHHSNRLIVCMTL